MANSFYLKSFVRVRNNHPFWSRSEHYRFRAVLERDRVHSANEPKAASAWLSAEGWFANANGVIGDADQEVLKLIADI
jgi:hypothetical protein